MTFDIYLLSKLSYDDAEPRLEQYIDGALQQFIESNAGIAHCKKYPTGGFWIGTFIEFAYLYGEMTVPKMTKGDAQMLMEDILPRKLTLMNPEDADDAIPELIAFWTFLKETYRFRSAGAIAKYLKSIEGKFKTWMMDPNRGGMTKNFMMAGMDSGVDMTSDAGIQEFQAVYNQSLKGAQPMNLLMNEKVPMVAPPPDIQEFLDLMGVDLPQEGELVDPHALMEKVMNSFETLDAMLQMMEMSPEAPPPPMMVAPLRSMLMQNFSEEGSLLSSSDIELLNLLAIAETSPGTILQDFETALNFVGTTGIPVSAKRQQMGGQYLKDLNSQLSTPIEHGLSRPIQKSYSFVHGLYLLLRATRLVSIVVKGKKSYMSLNPEIYDAWQQLNSTERYFTLFEAWMIQGHKDLLGDDQSGPFSEGDRAMQGWRIGLGNTVKTYAKYGIQENLNYMPGLHNLALMEMFGFIKITSGKPTKGKGWRIRKTEPLPWGTAMFHLVLDTHVNKGMVWESETNHSLSLQELQPVVSEYFPEWKQCLALPQRSFRPGRYIFKVSLGKIWRRIAIAAEATLADLSDLILESVEFDSDHLDEYSYKDDWGRKIEVMHPGADSDLSTADVAIGGLPLMEGSQMNYLFDFGDCWQFKVELEQVESVTGLLGKKKRKRAVGKILESHGKSPQQYPDYDDY